MLASLATLAAVILRVSTGFGMLCFSYVGLALAGLFLFIKPTRLLLQKFVLPKPGQASPRRACIVSHPLCPALRGCGGPTFAMSVAVQCRFKWDLA